MLRLLADENLKGAILRGLRLKEPEIDIVRVQDMGLSGAPDDKVLDWAAADDRILLTHDVNTIPAAAYRRVGAMMAMTGEFLIHDDAAVGLVVEDLLLLVQVSQAAEWQGQIIYVPL